MVDRFTYEDEMGRLDEARRDGKGLYVDGSAGWGEGCR
jgi:hypothetical protein